MDLKTIDHTRLQPGSVITFLGYHWSHFGVVRYTPVSTHILSKNTSRRFFTKTVFLIEQLPITSTLGFIFPLEVDVWMCAAGELFEFNKTRSHYTVYDVIY